MGSSAARRRLLGIEAALRECHARATDQPLPDVSSILAKLADDSRVDTAAITQSPRRYMYGIFLMTLASTLGVTAQPFGSWAHRRGRRDAMAAGKVPSVKSPYAVYGPDAAIA
jgi:hypothetical protein